MTVSSTIDREDFPGNGVATVFSLPFRFFNDSEIDVSLIDDATGVVTDWVLGVNYTLYGADQPEVDGNAVSQLTAIVAPATGKTLFVQRVLPITQKTSIINQGRFYAIVHENVFDRLTMMMQQLLGDSSRFLRVPASDAAPNPLPNAAIRANKVLAFDPDGNPVQSNLTLSDIESQSTDAAASAELARKWAENPEDSPVVPGSFSALHWAMKSEDFAAAAAASATSAARINTSAATGTVNALIGAYTPAIGALGDGLFLSLRPTGANTSAAPTFTPNNGVIAAKTIVKGNNLPLLAADIAGAGHWLELQYDASLDKWVLLNPANGVTITKVIENVGASVASNAMNISHGIGVIDFRSATLTSGAVSQVPINANLTLTVPSGATLGTVSATEARIAILLINNGGAAELAVANDAGGLNLDETGVVTTTAISAAANAANVVYSQTARSNVPYRVVGFIDSTQATAGVWASALTRVQGAGGASLVALQSQGKPFTREFVSTQQAFTNGSPFTVNHGLRKEYKLVNIRLICLTTDLGYPAGTILDMGPRQDNSAASYGFTSRPVGITGVQITIANTGIYLNTSNGVGAPTAITPTSWRMVVEAWA